jgi:hypothetical protein
MKTFSLGYMNEKNALKIVKALQGKTYMNFQVHREIPKDGHYVEIRTDYDASDIDILTLALSILAAA